MKPISLDIGDRKFEFSFGLSFLGDLIEETELTIDEIVDRLTTNPFKMVPTMMYLSAKNAADRNGSNLDFSYHELVDIIDEAGGINQDAVEVFLSTFTKTLTKDVPKEKSKPAQVKKK